MDNLEKAGMSQNMKMVLRPSKRLQTAGNKKKKTKLLVISVNGQENINVASESVPFSLSHTSTSTFFLELVKRLIRQ